MKIIGHGIDIVEIASIERLINRSGERFEERCFTPQERSACERGNGRIQFLAGRFAAKEAVLKALGTGWSQNVSFLDIEVQRLATGKPSVFLYAQCREIASELHITSWMLSISHSENYVVSSVIAVSDQG